jgi:hypothetical protein
MQLIDRSDGVEISSKVNGEFRDFPQFSVQIQGNCVNDSTVASFHIATH